MPTPRCDDVLRSAFRGVEAVLRIVGGRLSAPCAGRAPSPATPVGRDERVRLPLVADHETLVYELLDAHADTAELAAELVSEPLWAAHLDYLRGLQRSGRQTLAQMTVEGPR